MANHWDAVREHLAQGDATTRELARACHCSFHCMNGRLWWYKTRGLIEQTGRYVWTNKRGRRAGYWRLTAGGVR